MFSNLTFTGIIIVVATLLISLAIHEAVHAFTAHHLGDETAANEGRLTLNPLKHIDILTTVVLPAVLLLLHLPPIFIAKPVPFDPERVRFGEFGAALVAVAGPFSNLLLATCAGVLLRLDLLGGHGAEIGQIFMWINISLFVFNMIPIPPLDGSRLLYAFAPEPIQKIMYQIEAMGVLVIVVFLLLLSSFIGPLLYNVTHAIAEFLAPSYF